MQTIKFSHEYEKFPFNISNIDKAILLEILTTETEFLSQAFIEYDTKIQNENKYYGLPKGKVIILIIKAVHILESFHENRAIFTTVRRWSPEKEAYYRGLRGQEVKIEVTK